VQFRKRGFGTAENIFVGYMEDEMPSGVLEKEPSSVLSLGHRQMNISGTKRAAAGYERIRGARVV
jgi:hypothetical protein